MMDHRVFEPRSTGNDARRRNAISMALIILVGGALWLFALKGNGGQPTTTAPPQAQAGRP